MTNWIVTQTDRFAAAVSQRGSSDYSILFASCPDHSIPALRGLVGDSNPYEHPEVFAEKSAITYVKNVKTPLMLIAAGKDHLTTVEQAQRLYVALKYLSRDARLVVFEDEGHYVRRHGRPSNRVYYLKVMRDWFAKYLAGTSAPHDAAVAVASGTPR